MNFKLEQPAVRIFVLGTLAAFLSGDFPSQVSAATSVSDTLSIAERAVSSGDISGVIHWVDKNLPRKKPDEWSSVLERSKSSNRETRECLFAMFARSCCFAPREAVLLLDRSFASKFPLGPLVHGDVTRSVGVPNSTRYEKEGTIVGISISQPISQRRGLPCIVFVGVRKTAWKVGDPISVEDIDFVNTDFELNMITTSQTNSEKSIMNPRANQ